MGYLGFGGGSSGSGGSLGSIVSAYTEAVSATVEACAEVTTAAVETVAAIHETNMEAIEAAVSTNSGDDGVNDSAPDSRSDLDTSQLIDPNPESRMVYGPNGTTRGQLTGTALPADYYGPVRPMGPEVGHPDYKYE